MRRAQIASLIASQSTGPGVVTESISVDLAAASFDTRRRAAIQGTYGSSVNLTHWVLPGRDAATDYYVWWSHNGYNADPGDHVAALAGYTGIEVALGSGNHSAAARATATRAAIQAASALSCGGAGGTVTITGQIDAASCVVGGAYTARGAAGLFGHHTDVSLTNGNPLNDAIAVHGTFTAGPAAPTAVGVLLGTPAGTNVRLALYVGGSSVSFTGTTLVAEGTVAATSSGNVWAWLPLTAAQATALADNASIWLVAKSNNTHPTDGLHPAFSSLANSEDWTSRNLVIFTETGITADPSTPYPASLAGLEAESDIGTGFAVVMMAAFEYRTAPFCGDASLGGATANGLAIGVHSDGVFASGESDLLAPDAGGANVIVGMSAPPIIGKRLTRIEVAVGSAHTDQFRLYALDGGAIGAAGGATLIHDAGQTSGSATQSWVGIDVGAEPLLPDSGPLHIGLRGNGGISVRFAGSGAPEVVNTPTDPCDYPMSGAEEYETNTSNPNHSTNDAVAVESPIVSDPDDFLPGNFPGLRLRYRVRGDVMVAT